MSVHEARARRLVHEPQDTRVVVAKAKRCSIGNVRGVPLHNATPCLPRPLVFRGVSRRRGCAASLSKNGHPTSLFLPGGAASIFSPASTCKRIRRSERNSLSQAHCMFSEFLVPLQVGFAWALEDQA